MSTVESAVAGETPPRGIFIGIFLVSAGTLLLEVTLTRIFDVIIWSNLTYLVVGSALFGFGLGGVILFRWPMAALSTSMLLAAAACAFALSVVLIVPLIALLPINISAIGGQPLRQLLMLGLLYVSLVVPFVASGVAIAGALTRHVGHLHRLYFLDLLGAGIGCLGIFVLPQLIGGEETLFFVTALGLAGAAAFAPQSSWVRVLSGTGAALVAVLAVGLADRVTFPHLANKQGAGTVSEFSYWDPVSKIDVIRETNIRKLILYDGGQQRSHFYQFNGDLAALRASYFASPYRRYNTGRYVAVSHWLQRGKGGRVLVVGSAGGQETLAALTWGAAHVDAVEMVCALIRAAQGPFAEFIGGLYSHPRVSTVCDEGRNFLRRSERKYDVIQIHSNHTTSSMARGAGAAAPIYLQTVEAYKDYLTHLTPNGILQINHTIYPKILATAARAWSELFPGEDFRDHLLIADGQADILKTFLVKRSPWTAQEVAEVRHFLSPSFGHDPWKYDLIYAPGEPESRNVPEALLQVPLDPKLIESLPYRIEPVTDDKPFFRYLRKSLQPLKVDEAGFVPLETTIHINAPLRGIIPLDFVHIYMIGGLSVIIAGCLLFVPLSGLLQTALTRAQGLATLLYFGCLGMGFVMVELVLIYKFMLVVPPIHAMAVVIFAMLLGAGIGSALSELIYARLRRWAVVAAVATFVALIVCLLLTFPALDRLILGLPLEVRLAIIFLIVSLIGVPLGMPFPLGLAALSVRSPGLIPWGWAINAFMTVVGSVFTVLLSIWAGFTVTLFLTIGIYTLAGVCYLVLSFSLARVPGRAPVMARPHIAAPSAT
jgi:spermidine synthase